MPEYLLHRIITRTQSVKVVAASQAEAKERAAKANETDYSLPEVDVRHKVVCWSDAQSKEPSGHGE